LPSRRNRPDPRAGRQRDHGSLDPRRDRIVARVRAIPDGFVRTYGDIDPVAPRLVGQVLATIHDELPWHRVVRADGSLAKGRRQRALLVAEGVPMRGDRVDLRLARLSSTFEHVK
jgi:alkylated DNA nucleotide flippase Atl1